MDKRSVGHLDEAPVTIVEIERIVLAAVVPIGHEEIEISVVVEIGPASSAAVEMVADDWICAGGDEYGDCVVAVSVFDAVAGGQIIPASAAGVGGGLFAGAWRERRAEDNGDYCAFAGSGGEQCGQVEPAGSEQLGESFQCVWV